MKMSPEIGFADNSYRPPCLVVNNQMTDIFVQADLIGIMAVDSVGETLLFPRATQVRRHQYTNALTRYATKRRFTGERL